MDKRLDRRLVAVMFTDMVGYTALIQADERLALGKRDRYMSALERHHDAQGGTIVQRLGDGSMSMFPSSLAAVLAAVEIQRELGAQDIPVRIGIHVGEVIVEPERLSGDAVNIAARIESFAVPGGVMLSDAAHDHIKNRSDVGVVHLGQFKLKNVGRPFELYAVTADGVVVPDAAVLEGKGERVASLPSNLPEPAASLVGRAADLAALSELAREHRIVTITGPGGVGKTRVLVELGRLLAPEFLDGVAFVPFAQVTDPADFLPALADALDVKEAEERTLGEGIVTLIGDRKALLLLDNLEQVVAAAPDVAGLAERCPGLRIVTTSRTPLRIAAEREYLLSPLALPPSEADGSLAEYPAVALFVERARVTRGSFELTPENAGAVAAVCRRLDGLPLALELAAARLRLLSPEGLLERLDHVLHVLTSGARDAPERQQTLRATIDWSHSLLSEPEQRLFRRISVFAGGFGFDDVEAVCADPGEAVLDELESLVDKALVQADGQDGRLRMLQTIGEYAGERLETAGETREIALRHARWYAVRAREIRDGLEGTGQVESLERGIAEEANIQAALDTLLVSARQGDPVACEEGLQLCGDLWLYWHIRGKNLSAREYAASFLDVGADGAPTLGRAGALIAAGLASEMLGQLERANEEWAEARRIAAERGADRELCIAAFCQGIALAGIDQLQAGLRSTSEAIERARAAGFTWGEGFSSTLDGTLHRRAGDLDTAEARYSQALQIQRRIGDEEGAGLSLSGLARLATMRGDLSSALELYRQSLAAYEVIGDRAEEARILSEMAWTHLRNEDSGRARRCFLDSVQAYTDLASVRGVGLSLTGLAACEAVEGRPATAVQIAAAAEVYAKEEGIVNVYSDGAPGREFVDQARAALSAHDVDRATEIGRRLTTKEALDLARTSQMAAVQ